MNDVTNHRKQLERWVDCCFTVRVIGVAKSDPRSSVPPPELQRSGWHPPQNASRFSRPVGNADSWGVRPRWRLSAAALAFVAVTQFLSISVGPEGTAAVLAGTNGEVRVVALADSSDQIPTIVAADADGAVVIGDAAVGAAGPVVTDPMARAGAGKGGALSQILGLVSARTAAQYGSEAVPATMVLIIPDSMDAGGRDHVVAASNRVGFTDVRLVPRTLAVARSGSELPMALARSAAQLVAADLPADQQVDQPTNSPATADGPEPGAVTPPAGPSVFAPQPEVPPVRSVAGAQPPVDPDRTAVMPRAGGPTTGRQTPVPLGPGSGVSRSGRPPLPAGLIVAGVVVLLILGMVIGVQVRSSGESDSAQTVEVVQRPTTTPVPTTTAPSPTTSSSSTSSTTSTTTTTTTTTTTAPTTTAPVRLGLPGLVGLIDSGLLLSNQPDLQFGQPPETVIGAITSLLGDPDFDSGEGPNDFCDGDTSRVLRWGSLEVVFTGDVASGEPLAFSQWFADDYRDPENLVTPQGLGVTSSVGFLEAMFGSSLTLVPAMELEDDLGLFAITNTATGATLNGTTLGLSADGGVLSLWAGDACARVFA